MTDRTTIDRRVFLRRGAMGAGALWAMSLGELGARRHYGSTGVASPYGDPVVALDENTGLPLLKLPPGFRYRSYGWNGDVMSDGVRTPGFHDGMAVVDYWNNNPNFLVLVRNSELAGGQPYVGNRPDITYRNDGAGGTTNLIFDVRRGRFVKSYATLAGTVRNCAGGVTPWGTWLTGEETGNTGHGWCFDVGPEAGDPRPITGMGRFSHEAMMIDPTTNYIYETEDNGGNSGFYRFIPNVPGSPIDGGELSMLRVKGMPRINLGLTYPVPTTWDVEWVPIADPTAATRSCFNQGLDQDAARFRRLEGCWWANRTGYFLSTDGGVATQGQVFEYDPDAETLTLIYDSPSANDLDNPDNLVVTPRGGLLLCEDNATSPAFAEGERLVGLALDGTTFTFAVNNVVLTSRFNDRIGPGDYRQNEWAGACYSPDGQWLFANVFSPGFTVAITGPWGAGPL
jgi:secreted PhoX family phosphatase